MNEARMIIDETFGILALKIFFDAFRLSIKTNLYPEASVMAERARSMFKELQDSGAIPLGATLPNDVEQFLQGPIVQ